MTRRWAAIVAVGSSALFLACYLLGVRSVTGQLTENIVLSAANYGFGGLLSLVSLPSILIATVVITLLALFAQGWRTSASLIAGVGTSNVLAQVLKHGMLERPDLVESTSWNTFPSGHVVVYASLLCAFVIAVPRQLTVTAAAFATLVLGIVCCQLLQFAWHRPSDIVGGITLVTAIMALSIVVVPKPPQQAIQPARTVMVRLLLVTGGLCGALAGVSLAVAALGLVRDPSGLFLFAAQLGCLLAVCWMMATFAILVLPSDGRRIR